MKLRVRTWRWVPSCAGLNARLVNEVEEWEQKNPHQVNDMPVQADEVNRGVVVAAVATSTRAHDEPSDDTDTDNDMDAVESGHAVVDREELVRTRRQLRIEKVRRAHGGRVMDCLLSVLTSIHRRRAREVNDTAWSCERRNHRRLIDSRKRRQHHRERRALRRDLGRINLQNWSRRSGIGHRDLRFMLIDGPIEARTHDEILVDLVRVLEVLDDHESDGARERQEQADDQGDSLVGLRESHRHRHREARRDEDERVDPSQNRVEVVTRVGEDFGVQHPQHRVGHEQPAKEQYFGREKEPHTELAGVKLLMRRVEMVREEWVLRVLPMTMVMSMVMSMIMCDWGTC